MVLHGIALYDLVSYIIYLAIACFCVFCFVARAVSRKTPIPLIENDSWIVGSHIVDPTRLREFKDKGPKELWMHCLQFSLPTGSLTTQHLHIHTFAISLSLSAVDDHCLQQDIVKCANSAYIQGFVFVSVFV